MPDENPAPAPVLAQPVLAQFGGPPRRAAVPPPLALLLVGSAREILARLVPGDPLDVRPRVARRLASRTVFLDADRVHLRALARVARRAHRWRGRPDLSEWLGERVDEAIEDLLAEQARGERDRERDESAHGALVDLGRPLGLEPGVLGPALAALNARPEEERRALRQLLSDPAGDPAASAARESEVPAGETVERARRAFRAALEATLTPLPRRRDP